MFDYALAFEVVEVEGAKMSALLLVWPQSIDRKALAG